MTHFPPPPVFGDVRSWDQAAGGRLRLPEPDQNRRGALQPSSQAENGKGLSCARMPQLEGQQVEGGTYRLRSEQLGITHKRLPGAAGVGHVHTQHLSNHHWVVSSRRITRRFPACGPNTAGGALYVET